MSSFVAHAVLRCGLVVDPLFVVSSGCRWGRYVWDAYPLEATVFEEQAASLGFCDKEFGRMWAHLAKICVIAGTSPDQLSTQGYRATRTALHETVIAVRGYR